MTGSRTLQCVLSALFIIGRRAWLGAFSRGRAGVGSLVVTAPSQPSGTLPSARPPSGLFPLRLIPGGFFGSEVLKVKLVNLLSGLVTSGSYLSPFTCTLGGICRILNYQEAGMSDFPWCLSFAQQPCDSLGKQVPSPHPLSSQPCRGGSVCHHLGSHIAGGGCLGLGWETVRRGAQHPAGNTEWTLDLSLCFGAKNRPSSPVPEACFPRANISVVIFHLRSLWFRRQLSRLYHKCGFCLDPGRSLWLKGREAHFTVAGRRLASAF